MGGGDDVFHSYGANQGCVEDGETCLVVDSGFHNGTASQILQRVYKRGPRHLILVDTHYHSDHVFGNSVFSNNRAIIVSHEKCRLRMLAQSPRLLSKYKAQDPRLLKLLQKVRVTYPTITYGDQLKIHLDVVEAQIIHPGERAHTDGDSMVYVPDDRVLFSGDVLWVGYHPNLEDANIPGQVRALRQIIRLEPRKIVPGHGPVCGLFEVRRLIRYLEQFDRNLYKALVDKLTLDQTIDRTIPIWAREWKMRRLAESYVRSRWSNARG